MSSRREQKRQREQPPPADHRTRRFRWFTSGAERSGTSTTDGTDADAQEQLIRESLANLRDMDVREVMTPRVDVVALRIPVQADDVARAVRESGHRSFPVVHGDLDDLVGVLFVVDLFRTGRRPGPEALAEVGPLDISRRLRPAYVLPESLGVLDALADMRRQHRDFAVVVDEYGGVAGVLTVKDLLEPLVGDLRDELDEAEEPPVVRVDGTRWLVDGRASVDEVRERLGIEIPDGEYVTVGGFIFDGFGHIPEEGESLSLGDWELRVVEMDKRRVAKVVARRAGMPATGGAAVEAGPAPSPEDRPGAVPSPGRVAAAAPAREAGSLPPVAEGRSGS